MMENVVRKYTYSDVKAFVVPTEDLLLEYYSMLKELNKGEYRSGDELPDYIGQLEVMLMGRKDLALTWIKMHCSEAFEDSPDFFMRRSINIIEHQFDCHIRLI